MPDKPMSDDERERWRLANNIPSPRYYEDLSSAAKAAGMTEAERAKYANWQEALYAQGMPVAGHGEPAPENDPERNRGRGR